MESFSNGNGPGGPHVLVIDDTPLNAAPDLWAGMAPPGSV